MDQKQIDKIIEICKGIIESDNARLRAINANKHDPTIVPWVPTQLEIKKLKLVFAELGL